MTQVLNDCIRPCCRTRANLTPSSLLALKVDLTGKLFAGIKFVFYVSLGNEVAIIIIIFVVQAFYPFTAKFWNVLKMKRQVRP